MIRPAAVLAVGVALAGPWTTGIQGWARTPADGVLSSPLLLLLAGLLALAALWVLERDQWLGLLGLWVVARAALTLGPPMLESALYLVGGLVVLCLVREAGVAAHRWIPTALAAAGGLQAAYAILQWVGYHPLAVGWAPLAWQPDGTLGNPNYLGAYLAATIAFAPWWALPWWAAGLVLSQSALAGIAAAAALVLRSPRRWVALPAAAALAAGVLAARGLDPATWWLRLATWDALLAAMHGPALLLGYAPGSWAILGPRLAGGSGQLAGEGWAWAHCEPLQLLFEVGVLGLGLAAAAAWTHRRAILAGPAGAAAAAIGVLCLASFPLHMPAVGPTCAVILGLALRPAAGAPR